MRFGKGNFDDNRGGSRKRLVAGTFLFQVTDAIEDDPKSGWSWADLEVVATEHGKEEWVGHSHRVFWPTDEDKLRRYGASQMAAFLTRCGVFSSEQLKEAKEGGEIDGDLNDSIGCRLGATLTKEPDSDYDPSIGWDYHYVDDPNMKKVASQEAADGGPDLGPAVDDNIPF